MKNAINWFEIPVVDITRAKKFYETIFNIEMIDMEAMGMVSAFFPADLEGGGVGGSLIFGDGYKPSNIGTLLYLNGGDNLEYILSKVQNSGGKIILPKTAIGQHGFMAHFEDTEGNKIGLHSMA